LWRASIARIAAPATRCSRCALPLARAGAPCGACLRAAPPFEASVAAVDYRYPWDRLLARLKFSAALDLAPALASLLDAARRRIDAPPPELLVPVPLARARLRERGFNQAWEIARRLPVASASARPDLLLRVKDTEHQPGLVREQREANVGDAFAVEPRHAARLRGADVAIVDDVMTSGATAAELARTLLRAGAARVRVWVVARTPAPDDV
jgi:ComF family protein